jgi:hypothetical protein
MPSVNTYRRILAEVASQEEVERMVGKYNQEGEHGEVYGMDGKAVRGMRKKDEEGSEYLLSVYDVKHWKVLAQVEVGRKENEISKAPKVLESVEISQKVITGDAMHTQKALSGQIVRQGGDSVDEKFGSMIYRNNLCKDTREWMIDFINTLGNELAVTL